MDALEQYLKIEKLDPAQISDSSVQHKELKYNEMSQEYVDVESKGKTFIEQASKVRAKYEFGQSLVRARTKTFI